MLLSKEDQLAIDIVYCCKPLSEINLFGSRNLPWGKWGGWPTVHFECYQLISI